VDLDGALEHDALPDLAFKAGTTLLAGSPVNLESLSGTDRVEEFCRAQGVTQGWAGAVGFEAAEHCIEKNGTRNDRVSREVSGCRGVIEAEGLRLPGSHWLERPGFGHKAHEGGLR
jgi:hypothetical protein